jgi:sodium/hydrogen exchanger-like protein 6/7/sodium/hydrogen exchanger 8
MESPITPKKEKSLSEAQRIIKYLDENYFKRWFIHDYDTRRKQILNLKRDIKKRDL